MTERDLIKEEVKRYLESAGPDISRQQRIAQDVQDMQDYVRKISVPADVARSPIESESNPVRQVDTVLPQKDVFYNDPPPNPSGLGSAPDSFSSIPGVMICVDGEVQVVDLVVR